jgi:hypothetical protein
VQYPAGALHQAVDQGQCPTFLPVPATTVRCPSGIAPYEKWMVKQKALTGSARAFCIQRRADDRLRL